MDKNLINVYFCLITKKYSALYRGRMKECIFVLYYRTVSFENTYFTPHRELVITGIGLIVEVGELTVAYRVRKTSCYI